MNSDGCTVTVELKDAEGNMVGAAGVDAEVHAHAIIDVQDPHLWQGMEDPYLYTATASIVKDDAVVDAVTVTYGYRSFRVDAATGFYLNGRNIPLRGVSRHQDRLDKGWAVSKAYWTSEGFYTIRMVCREATPKQLAQLNRLLSRVKK